MGWSDAPSFPPTNDCGKNTYTINYSCPDGYTPNSTKTNCTAAPTKTCPDCFALNASNQCYFTGLINNVVDARCYRCQGSILNYTGTTTPIYSTTVVGNQCPINTYNTSPSPWGNDSLFDGNTTVGLSYLLTKLGNVNNFTSRDGSVKCYPGKVCTNVTLTSGPLNGTAITAGTGCPAGYYCTSIDTAPIVCPLGSYCPAGASLPTACSAGSYCVAGSSSQTPCPAGYYCEKGNLKTPCLPGTYSASTGASSASACLVCPAGSYCPSGSASATTCPAGNFCPLGSGALNQCTAGYYCPTTTAQILCPGATTCPAGTSSNYGIVCDRTTVPNGAYSACSACPNPAAYYIWDPAYATSPTSIVLPPATTIDGPYEPVRFRSVTVNNFNFIAGKSILATSGGFKITGTVLSSTASELVMTVNGYSGTGTSSTAWTITPFGCDTVVKCQGHMKSSADFTKCEGCPLPAAGFIWAGSSGCETVQCTDGLIPNSDLTTCTSMVTTCATNAQCAAGQTCGTYGQCRSCAPGTACATCPASTPFWDGTACTACPIGQYWNGTACTACANTCLMGTYETSTCTSMTNRVCGTCTAGNYCLGGSFAPIQCTAGNYCPSGSSRQTQCTAGNYCPSNGMASQTQCSSPSASQYVTAVCNATTDTQFGNKMTCASNQYMTGYSAGAYNSTGSSGGCNTCSSPSASQYVTAVCNATTNTQFGNKTAPCTATNQYMTGYSAGAYNSTGSAGWCATCSNPSSSQYVTAVCNATTNTQIVDFPGCSYGYRVGNSTGSYNSLGSEGYCRNPTMSYGTSGGSDIRLKRNVKKTGRMIGVLPEYTWEWNDEAGRVGVSSDPTIGIIAQEALHVYPEVVSVGVHGYYMVNYDLLIKL